jgi:hypothetical protein
MTLVTMLVGILVIVLVRVGLERAARRLPTRRLQIGNKDAG